MKYRLTADTILILAADQAYQEMTSATSFSGVFDVPKTCATGGSCANVATDLGIKNATSETKGELCEVTGALDNTPNTHSGTYTVNGNALILDGKTDSSVTFCVAGDTLVLRSVQERQVVLQTFTRK